MKRIIIPSSNSQYPEFIFHNLQKIIGNHEAQFLADIKLDLSHLRSNSKINFNTLNKNLEKESAEHSMVSTGLEQNIIKTVELSLNASSKAEFSIEKRIDVLLEDVIFESDLFLARLEFGLLISSSDPIEPFVTIGNVDKNSLRLDAYASIQNWKTLYFKKFKIFETENPDFTAKKVVQEDTETSLYSSHGHEIISFLDTFFAGGLANSPVIRKRPEFAEWVDFISGQLRTGSNRDSNTVKFGSYLSLIEGESINIFVNDMVRSHLYLGVMASLIESYGKNLSNEDALHNLIQDTFFVGDQLYFKLEFGQNSFYNNKLKVLEPIGSTEFKGILEYSESIKIKYRDNFENGLKDHLK